MNCTTCSVKGCRKFEPCLDRSEKYLADYQKPEFQKIIKNASNLVDNGRAGSLNRLEEIVEYCHLQGYQKIGVAYCYGLEKEAGLLRNYLNKQGLKVSMVSCTVDGLSETDLDHNKTKRVVSCNPLGQANVLNREKVELTILMGLCLGHDILLQKNLQMDFTTFVVKDRKLYHNPLLALYGVKDEADIFLENLPQDFHLISTEDFINKTRQPDFPEKVAVIDFRSRLAFEKARIPHSVQISIKELPGKYRELLPDKKQEIITVCNGGKQSLYAAMYLRMKGYTNVKSLGGGFTKWLGKKPR